MAVNINQTYYVGDSGGVVTVDLWRRVRWRQGGARDEDIGYGCVEVRVVVAVIRELAGERWEAPKIGEKKEVYYKCVYD
nr:hypothetical protein [Tanacetum cinerariifolium]